jgi:glycosyltransferase involved in cell wall biosynthesis
VLLLFRPKSFRFMRLCLAYYVIYKAGHLSVASPYMVGYLRKWHNVREDISVIPNAVPILDLSTCIRKEKNKIVFVEMASGFSSCKNVKNLLRAFALLKNKTYPLEVELRLYGWGYGPSEECESWARKNKLADGVVFRGRMEQSDMHREVAEMGDVFVHSSREESFGAVIVEAMNCGLATIVGAKSGACSWVTGYGETGLLVDVNNPVDIADAMYKLAIDGELRNKFSLAGKNRAREVFSLEKVARQYLKMYERILSCERT